MTRLLLLALLGTSATTAPRLAQTGAPPADRGHVALAAIHRSGAVPRCWNAYLQSDPNAVSVRFRLRAEIAASGAVERVALLDPVPSALADCLRSQLRRVSVAPGPAVTVETTYSFVAGSPAPVPAAP
jgi:hypothetical protein